MFKGRIFFNNRRGFTDPITLIGLTIVFIITVVSGLAVSNKNVGININQKAANNTICPDDMCNSHADCGVGYRCIVPAVGCHYCQKVPSPSTQSQTPTNIPTQSVIIPTNTLTKNDTICLDVCTVDSDCGDGMVCKKPSSGCPTCITKPIGAVTLPIITQISQPTIIPTTTPTPVITKTLNNSTIVCADPCLKDTDCGINQYCYRPVAPACAVCKDRVCVPGQVVCVNETLKQCNSIGSYLNTQRDCPYGCNGALNDCNPAPTNKLENTSCLDPCTTDNECGYGNYCYKPTGGCNVCKPKGSTCAPNTTRCSGDYLETCNQYGTSWSQQFCSAGCINNSSCKIIIPTPTSISPTPILLINKKCVKGLGGPDVLEYYVDSKWKEVEKCLGGTCDSIKLECVYPNSNIENNKACDVYGCYSCPDGNRLIQVRSTSAYWCITTTGNYISTIKTINPTTAVRKSYGEKCNDDSECQSNVCSKTYTGTDGTTVYQFFKVCAYSLVEQQAYAAQKSERDYQAANAAMTAVTLGNIYNAGSKIVSLAQGAGGPVTLTSLGQATYSYTTSSIATSPTLQTGLSVLTLSQLPATVIICEKYGHDSPQCLNAGMMVAAGYQIDPIGTEQSLQNSAQQLSSIINTSSTTTVNNNLSTLRQQIRDQLSAGDNSGVVTTTLANKKIDQLIENGTDELDAITQVGSAIVPDYATTAEEKALLGLADKAKTADQVMQCQFTWCRQNAVVSDALLSDRGYDPYRAIMTLQTAEGASAGGHHVSAVLINDVPVFIDITNGKTISGVEALQSLFSQNGQVVSTLQLIKQNSDGAWQILDLIKKP